MNRIRKGDQVLVIAGKNKGQKGEVTRVAGESVFVQNINLVKRHTKPRSAQIPGGIIEKEASVHISSVMLVCPKCGKPTRTSTGRLANGKKVRVCGTCEEMITGE